MSLEHDWTFICEICNRVVEMDEAPDGCIECCDHNMKRVFEDHKVFHINGKPYIRTKFSDSLAISPSQIAEHKEMFPNIPVSPEGQVGFENVEQQDKYLDTCGFHKWSQKLKPKGTRIA